MSNEPLPADNRAQALIAWLRRATKEEREALLELLVALECGVKRN